MTAGDTKVMAIVAASVAVLLGALLATHRSSPDPGPLAAASAPGAPLAADALVATISQGEQVEIGRYLVPGRRTVVEFTAEW